MVVQIYKRIKFFNPCMLCRGKHSEQNPCSPTQCFKIKGKTRNNWIAHPFLNEPLPFVIKLVSDLEKQSYLLGTTFGMHSLMTLLLVLNHNYLLLGVTLYIVVTKSTSVGVVSKIIVVTILKIIILIIFDIQTDPMFNTFIRFKEPPFPFTQFSKLFTISKTKFVTNL